MRFLLYLMVGFLVVLLVNVATNAMGVSEYFRGVTGLFFARLVWDVICDEEF